MLEKLRAIEEKYETLSADVCLPELIADRTKYTQTMRELRQLEPVVTKYREYRAALEGMDEARALEDEAAGDTEMRELARAEHDDCRTQSERALNELKILLLPRDPNDERSVIVEIRGGAGGEEAALFAAALFRMYSMYGETKGYKTEILSASETELGGYKEISFSLSGDGAYSRF
ncbi:MAG: PCRF domain-containing protein, partial [Oscillospiraceae bacterium]|nr:PCRF domain-containing protein [Oscillospiraceae bacterium]